jgi:hypothetical protein
MKKRKNMHRKIVKVSEDSVAIEAGGIFAHIWNFIIWFAGVMVSLAVGYGMIDKVLVIWKIPAIITQITGGIVVALTLLGVALKILDKLSKK